MATAESRVEVREKLHEVTYHVEIFVDGERVGRTPAERLARGGVARRDDLLEKMKAPANWPSADKLTEEKAWVAAWNTQRHTHPKPTDMSAAHACGTRWFGGCGLEALRQYGSVRVDDLADARDCAALARVIERNASRASLVHEGVYPSKVNSATLMTEEDAAEERRARAEIGSDVAILKGEEGDLLDRVVARMVEGAGQQPGVRPFVEGLTHSGLMPPQWWHGDWAGSPRLAGVLMLSPAGVPPYTVSLLTDWGAGGPETRLSIGKLASGRAGKAGKSEMEATAYLQARRLRWQRVYDGGDNWSELVASYNVSGARLGLTEGGNASAIPRRTMYGEWTVRRPGGVRPTVEQGTAVFFDATSPHRGPGGAVGEQRRTVLYVSWAGKEVRDGAMVLARPPIRSGGKGKAKAGAENYRLAFDADGNYLLGEMAPREIGAKRKRDPEITEAAAICQGLRGGASSGAS